MPGENSFNPPVAQPAAAPANSPQAPAGSPQSGDTESDLSSDLRQAMMASFSSSSAGSNHNDLPAGLVGGQQPAQPTGEPDASTQIQAIAGSQANQLDQGAGQENTGEPEQPAGREDGREEISAIHLERFGRDFSLAEVEAAIEGFNYYHPKVMKFQEDVQRFQAEVQKFEELKTSPEMHLAGLLKTHPDLKERFLQVVRDHNPGALQAHESNQQVEALKAEIAELKGMVGQTQQNEQQRNEQAKQAAWQRHVLDTTRAVDQATDAKLAQLKQQGVDISEQEIELVCQNAVAMVQAGKLKYDAQTMTGYFNNMFDLIAGKALAARQQSINGYQQVKQALPPAPPSGGGAPVIAPDSPKNFNDMEKILANRLEAILGQM